jgi:hypothetical protein
MQIRQLNAARSYMVKEAIDRIVNHKDNPDQWVIITPAILEAMSYNLPKQFTCSVIFLDFCKGHELVLPKDIVFERNVIISQTILKAFHECQLKGDLVLDDVQLDLVPMGQQLNEPYFKPFPLVKGNIFLNRTMFNHYRDVKAQKGIRNNLTFIVLEPNEIRDILIDSYNKTKKLDFVDYLNTLGLAWNYNIKDKTYTVEEDLLLLGPYHYSLPVSPNRLIIKGDLIIFDDTAFRLPKKEHLSIDGQIDIRGTL